VEKRAFIQRQEERTKRAEWRTRVFQPLARGSTRIKKEISGRQDRTARTVAPGGEDDVVGKVIWSE